MIIVKKQNDSDECKPKKSHWLCSCFNSLGEKTVIYTQKALENISKRVLQIGKEAQVEILPANYTSCQLL